MGKLEATRRPSNPPLATIPSTPTSSSPVARPFSSGETPLLADADGVELAPLDGSEVKDSGLSPLSDVTSSP